MAGSTRFTRALRPSSPLSRRDLMALGAGVGLATLLPGGARAQPVTPRIDAMLRAMSEAQTLDLPHRRSNGGMLDTRLDVGYATNQYPRRPDGRPGRTIHTRSYEGATTGPILEINPGEWLKITSANNLPPDTVFASHNLPNRFNTYNLHTHGLHVSPSGNSDNVVDVEIAPGDTFVSDIHIPVGHPPGLYWYHPHRHGSSAMQLASGMAGALVVRGAIDTVPEIAAAREQIMVLQAIQSDDSGRMEEFIQVFLADETVVTINGVQQPIIVMRPGEVMNWRLLNACDLRELPVYLDGHPIHLYEIDGNTLPRTRRLGGIKLTPGNRASFLVQAGPPGLYFLKSAATDAFSTLAYGETTLAILLVTGTPVSMALPQGPLPQVDALRPITDDEITGRRSLTLQAVSPYPDAFFNLGMLMDGARFDATVVNQHIRLGAVEEWTVHNLPSVGTASAAHPFHIHTNPIYVTKVNGVPLDHPYWCDTVSIDGPGGSVTFRTRFLDFTGKMMLHCHATAHADMGMAQLAEISR